MQIREMFKRDFGVDLPISGGHGNSMENAVIVHRVVPNDYVAVEYAYLKYLGMGRGISWEMLGQEMRCHEGKRYDRVRIKTTREVGDQVETTIEGFYFDITECFGD